PILSLMVASWATEHEALRMQWKAATPVSDPAGKAVKFRLSFASTPLPSAEAFTRAIPPRPAPTIMVSCHWATAENSTPEVILLAFWDGRVNTTLSTAGLPSSVKTSKAPTVEESVGG